MTDPSDSVQHEIKFIANPTQRQFIEHRSSNGQQVVDLFSCRMGEGKSCALVWACFYYTRENPGARGVIIRDTWENCRDTTLVEFLKWFPDGVMGTWTAFNKTFTWGIEGVKGSVTFLGMDDEKDASKLQSREYGFVGIDEPSPAAGTGGVSELVFQTALTRLRQPGMNWYAAKLAQNNPDESHWTYKNFTDPDTRKEGYVEFKTVAAENLAHLPPDYYGTMTKNLAGRQDLVRRFVTGEYGFQQLGKAVTPNWSDTLHLRDGLEPVPGTELTLLWDFGLNPTCIITQKTPLGFWLILEDFVGTDENGWGTYELISEVVKPRLEARYDGFVLRHIGDPAGEQREQSSSKQSAVKVIKAELGGKWTKGEKDIRSRINPLNAVLSRTLGGEPILQVDRRFAKRVHHALRGGWHYQVSPGGVVAGNPRKNEHSHPGDAMGYGAAKLFPHGRLTGTKVARSMDVGSASFFGRGRAYIGRPGLKLPKDGEVVPDQPE